MLIGSAVAINVFCSFMQLLSPYKPLKETNKNACDYSLERM